MEAVVGRPVRLTPGTWSGGWDAAPEFYAAQATGQWLTVCREPSGTDCAVLGDSSVELAQRWAGWYLFVDETRWFHGVWGSTLFPSPLTISVTPLPYRIPRLWTLGANQTRSAPVQVCCVLPAPAVDTLQARPASPAASVRPRAQRRKGRLHVARVACAVRCAVRLTVTSATGTVAHSFAVQGARSLSIRPRAGLLSVRVSVDGKVLARGRSRSR